MPVAVEPVNATRSTSGWRPIASPASLPKPVTTLNTPGGTPASNARSAIRSVDSDVCSAGFTTTLLPTDSAGPIFHASISAGKFHGSTAPTTPIGSRVIMLTTPAPDGDNAS